MKKFEHISVIDAWKLTQNKEQNAVLLDIRDADSFQQSHPQGAYHLTQNNLNELCESFEFDRPLMLICYHGISSHAAAQYFVSYGFEYVYTVDGGFVAWQRACLPVKSGNE